MPIPFKLDYVIERTAIEQSRALERRALRRALAGVPVDTSAAQAAWPRILEHKWYVSERLGRDVGLRVAAIDYFENVQLPRHTRAAKTHTPWLRRATQAHGVVA